MSQDSATFFIHGNLKINGSTMNRLNGDNHKDTDDLILVYCPPSVMKLPQSVP